MKSRDENLHKTLMQSKINETKDVMKRKAREIDKSKIEKGRLDKGGLMSISGPRKFESSFSDMSISSSGSGFGSGPGFATSSSADIDTFSMSKGRPSALATAPPKGMGMQLGKGKKTNQFLESLKVEGEVIHDEVHVPSAAQSKLAAVAATDSITLTIEERLNVAIKRNGGLNSFDVQGHYSFRLTRRMASSNFRSQALTILEVKQLQDIPRGYS